MSVEIGKNIKRIRTTMDKTQGDISKELGISISAVSSWEVGRTEPDMGTITRLCEYLNCGIVDIIGEQPRRPEAFYVSESEKELLRRYRTSPHQKAIDTLLGM